MKTSDLIGAGEIRDRTRVTRRQLQHWIHIGLARPSLPTRGRGRPARFDSQDLAWIGVLVTLVELGVEPAAILEATRTEGVIAYATRLEFASERLRRTRPCVA